MKNNAYEKSLAVKPTLININIFLFTYTLLRYIFLKKKQSTSNQLYKRLNEWLEKINKKLIISMDNFITMNYTLKNLKNIILLVKKQNLKYCGDIIENILIFIFSKAFNCDQENAIYKYVFNNLSKIRESRNEFYNWINKNEISPYEFKTLDNLFDIDGKEDEFKPTDNKSDSIFYQFLREILREKYNFFLQSKNERYNKNMVYIYGNDSFNSKINLIMYNKLKKAEEEEKEKEKQKKKDKEKDNDKNKLTVLDKDIITNSIMNLISNLSFPLSEKNRPINQLILSFFTQVYIYYQNKNSYFRQNANKDENLEKISFVYDLRIACIEGRFSYVVIAPMRIGDFMSKIYLKQNNLRENGLYELGKLCVFNDNIKIIECDTCLIRSSFLDYFSLAMGVFYNNSAEELNLSYNYLRRICDEFLIKIIKHLKNLRTLNVTSNEMHEGLSSIFVILKKLYRKNQTKIENLILNRCSLNSSSFYELSELLKCKYCKLKKIIFNNNPIPRDFNFLKSLKKNKSLVEIHFNKAEVNNSCVNDILLTISNSNIRTIYLFKNKLTNFNNCLRILYRTRIIKNKSNDDLNKYIIKNEDTALINLDLSNNDFPIKNDMHMKLVKKIINETSLYLLDICHILYGQNPDKNTIESDTYKKIVEEMKFDLEKERQNYILLKEEIRDNEVNIERIKECNNIEVKDFINFIDEKNLDKYLNEIYNDKDSDLLIHLQKKAKEIIEIEGKKEINNKENVDKLTNFLKYKYCTHNLNKLRPKEHKKKLIII